MLLSSVTRHRLIAIAKIALAVGILGFLLYRLRGQDVFTRFVQEPKHWGILVLAQAAVLSAFSISCVRWFFLVRALGIEFQLRDAFRLGSLGFLLSQVSLGSIGGDLFKALFIAREQPEQRTHAVATVVIDRVVGLYAMILVASVGLLLAGGLDAKNQDLQTLARIVAGAAVLGTFGLAALLMPTTTSPAVREKAGRWPLVGPTLAQLVDAASAYRDQRKTVFGTIFLGICTHCLLIAALWLIGQGIPVEAPRLVSMMLIGPLSFFAGALPLTPSGLGTFEGTMEVLYSMVGAAKGDGTLVALTYRVMTYVVASIGAVYYVSSRRTLKAAFEDAIEDAEEFDGQLDPTDLVSGKMV